MSLLGRATVVASLAVLVSCGSGPIDVGAPEGRPFEKRGTGGDRAGAPIGAETKADSAGSRSVVGGGSGQVQAGILTAGVWDDNLNFNHFETYRNGLAQASGLPAFTSSEQVGAQSAAGSRSPKSSLDIALVIDTTGSMGDEITYLQAEFAAISQRLQHQYPSVPQRWALVAYRDTQDDYVIKGVDFGTSVSWFQQELNKLAAGGGGDFPEAPDQALSHTATLSWNPDPSAAHLAFWVADAPHHDQNAGAILAAARALQAEGIHVYPVASSGIDELTEYTMRATAQLTLGRYIFLTDDSGVGGSHKAPSIPCYWVTKLDAAMERAVSSELTGSIVTVDPAAVIRSVGTPQNGACALDANASALVF